MAEPCQPGISSRVCARIGLLGNPSDGYEGACISVSLCNFYAEVTLTPSSTLRFIPNPESDPTDFASLEALALHITGNGYYGGVRLLMAMCKRFWEYCAEHGVALSSSAGAFSLSYSTTIPRQAGLSGSSAIACAALNCLLQHYGVEAAVPVEHRPQLVLSAEAELGITAGLQDRVIQVYGGAVYMDFSPAAAACPAGGRYESIDPGLLPPLHLLHNPAPGGSGKDSGQVHSDAKQCWREGEPAVREAMQQSAALAQEGRAALQAGDTRQLASLMDRNFELRRRVFGDAVVGAANLALVAAARSVGAAAKLTGSGGAVVALCPEGERQTAALREACQRAGFVCEPVRVGPVLHKVGGS